jgi:hypothetical protein
VTWRSVLLGLSGVVLICGLTPYNDYALNNTFLVGNNLPLGVVMLLFVFAVFINGPLSRFAPRFAFSGGEIAVAFTMALVSCALPSSGLMRYFPPSLVSPFWHLRSNPQLIEVMDALHLPKWIFPAFKGSKPSEWMNDPIVTGYLGRWNEDDPIPYWAWVRPALTWGIFIFALYGALLCMVAMVRRQWFENERLPFPLAQIQLALVEPPPRGRWLNDILRRRSFWIAFFAVFLLHLWNGCWKYWPRYFPQIPVYYNLTTLFDSAPPWKFVDQKLKDAAIFFTAVGVSYFLTSSVAFSLWAFYLFSQIYKMILGTTTGDAAEYGRMDEHIAGIFAYFFTILWVGRKHWQVVIGQAFRGHRRGEARGRYLSYPVAFWGFLGCALTMIGWLAIAGCGILGAAVVVSLLLLLFFMITRIIAETGLVHGQLIVPLHRPWQLLAMWGHPNAVSMETFYYTAMLNSVHYDFREIVPVYATHAMKVADQTAFESHRIGDSSEDLATGRKIMATMFLALLVGYPVSFYSTLWTEYHFASTRDVSQTMPINEWGASSNSRWLINEPTNQYKTWTYKPNYSIRGHMVFGFLFTAALGFLRLRYAWWPLHPIGYLMLGTFPGAHLWLSIFIGWLAKTLIVRFGGAKMYVSAKPFFIGLIVGEGIAAAFWLVMGIALSAMNIPYRPVNIMPG